MPKKLISIISPCFNEEKGIKKCYETIKDIFLNLEDYEYEHIFCDNCSSDRTVDILKSIAEKDKNIKIILNSRNFGLLNNTYNGVMNSSGDATLLFMPIDMQDPPELIPNFIELWEKGNDIVYGVRAKREEGFFLRTSRRLYYKLLKKVTYVDYPENVGDFQLVDKKVIEAMKLTEDANPFMRLMTFDAGFRSTGVEYTWRAREYGKSQNGLLKMFEQGLNGLISFSGLPLRLSLIIGLLISSLSILYSISIFIMTLFGFVDSQAGIPTIIVALFFFGGVQLFFIGILGEYILAIFNQVRKKPLVIEKERINF
ncbi:glycosyltransferase family 2 protein [SAR86 cluster bacterium]|nr:glycosyltransferase family 2 protein [SAR86 cluster bacterium]